MREPRPEAGNHAGTEKNVVSSDFARIPSQIRAAGHVPRLLGGAFGRGRRRQPCGLVGRHGAVALDRNAPFIGVHAGVWG